MGGRFEHLEGGQGLPDLLKAAVAKIARFDHLEVGDSAVPPRPEAPPSEKPPCPGCGQPNELERETCWACHRVLIATNSVPAAPGALELVVDGVRYRSDQPSMPEDVRELMSRVEREGYSEKLMSEWTEWRQRWRSEQLLKGSSAAAAPAWKGPEVEPPNRIKILRGRWATVITVDGKSYQSDDAVQSPEMHQLFAYIEEHGVTPALVAYIEQFGRTVDLGGEERAPSPRGWIASETQRQNIEHAQEKLEEANQRLAASLLRLAIPAALILLYGLFRMFH